MKFLALVVFFIGLSPALAQVCDVKDRVCVTSLLIQESGDIENATWRDQTRREIAKTLANDGQYDQAIALIGQIETPDTKAMTIRGIGMEAAENKLNGEAYTTLFVKLRAEAEKITHPPSYAIALTYIAMAQAFAGDDTGAWATAKDMENDALRNKAYGETAEIQAEMGKDKQALQSISYISTESFRNKAYTLISKILADREQFQEALNSAMNITNAYKKSSAIQYILDMQDKIKKEAETQKDTSESEAGTP